MSINAKMVNYADDFEEDNSVKIDAVSMKPDGASGKQEGSKQDGVNARQDSSTVRGDEAEGQTMTTDQGDADQGASSEKSEQKSTEHFNGDVSLELNFLFLFFFLFFTFFSNWHFGDPITLNCHIMF